MHACINWPEVLSTQIASERRTLSDDWQTAGILVWQGSMDQLMDAAAAANDDVLSTRHIYNPVIHY